MRAPGGAWETDVSNKPPRRNDKHSEAVVKRVSRKAQEEDHSGAWKVAFADFCLALMCLFLVLWVMAAREQERIQEVMRSPGGSVMDEGQGIMPETAGGPRGSLIAREPVPRRGAAATSGNAVAQGGGEPVDPIQGPFAPKVRYESQRDLEALSQLLARLSIEAGLANNLQSVVTPYGLRVMLHDTDRQGMFERGSWVPGESFRGLLQRMGPLFAQMENQVLIVGHTDSLQYAHRGHAAFSNWTLSNNRAMAARAQLLAGGMASGSILQVVGMADRAPLDTKNTAAAFNRRIELLILTSEQARVISAMFGAPRAVQPLIEGADAVLSDSEAARALHTQMLARKGGGAIAN
jgi:chemotaxis protein MotB